ncbi:MAG: hypothetical protein QXP12_08325 [Ignisphaera sp.]
MKEVGGSWLEGRYVRGQGELLATVILIGVTLVIGIGLTTLVVPNVSRIVGENNVRSILYSEQSGLVVYTEYGDDSRLCLGLLRVEPQHIAYSVAITDRSFNPIANNVDVFFPLDPGESPLRRTSTIYYLCGGEYCRSPGPVPIYSIPERLISKYIEVGEPLLLCIDRVSLQGGETVVLILVSIDNKLYEVGRLYA